ncbi:MAG TPA: IclR family transcriptional regulator, partial [Oscillospiraceae bacterium]|nr:IclR family transcriptional regulator [Oscillospiraceae bacterium]
VYIDKVESNANSVRMVSRIGLRQPVYCTAVGKAMLAELPLEKVREIWDGSEIKKYTPNTITDFNDLLNELEEIRKNGYAIDNEENELGVRCIAASIKNFEGRADNAFSISAPVSRLGDERVEMLSQYLLETKEKLSRELGGIL